MEFCAGWDARDIVARLSRDIGATLQLPKIKERVAAQARSSSAIRRKRLTGSNPRDSDKWSRLIRQRGIKLE